MQICQPLIIERCDFDLRAIRRKRFTERFLIDLYQTKFGFELATRADSGLSALLIRCSYEVLFRRDVARDMEVFRLKEPTAIQPLADFSQSVAAHPHLLFLNDCAGIFQLASHRGVVAHELLILDLVLLRGAAQRNNDLLDVLVLGRHLRPLLAELVDHGVMAAQQYGLR